LRSRGRSVVGVRKRATAVDEAVRAEDPRRWLEADRDPYLSDTRSDYEAMGLVVYQARQVQQGIREIRDILTGGAARVDGWALDGDSRRTAGFLCVNWFQRRGDRRLGAGLGGYLFLSSEVSQLVRDVCNELCRRLDREPVFATDGTPELTAGQKEVQDARAEIHRLRSRNARLHTAALDGIRHWRSQTDAAAAEFEVDGGKFVATHEQHRRYVAAVTAAKALKRVAEVDKSSEGT
jgi:hypothetical protein